MRNMVEKTCGNCTHSLKIYMGVRCGQIDFEMPDGLEDAIIKPDASAIEMCGEEYWEQKS
jgi:hypothetical protein